MTIGERIKLRREELGYSQEDVAFKLGYKSRASIYKIELGDVRLQPEKIKAIADVLETTPDWIMGWTDNKKETPAEPKLDGRSKEFVDLFGDLTSDQQELVLAQLQVLLKRK